LKTLKHLYERFSNAIFHFLQPLGMFGVFAMAFVDSAALGMPLDPTMGWYFWASRTQPLRVLALILLAAAGSAAGSIVIYAIGKKGGEALLHSRVSKARAARMEAWFERHEFLALMLPAILPPPMPFKLFMLAAAGFQMHLAKYLMAIFAGRVLRFSILAVLVIRFGPGVIAVFGRLVHDHPALAIAIAAVLLTAIVLYLRKRK
jgi:membrane protein YqaA with SNARE-associated domain